MNKELKKILKELQRQGGYITDGHKHVKVFSADGKLITVLPHGQNRDRVPGGAAKVLKKRMSEAGYILKD